MTPGQRWERTIGAAIRAVAGFDVPPERGFFEAGLTSAHLVAVYRRLVDQLGADVPVTVFFTYPSRRALGAFLAGGRPAPEERLATGSGAGPEREVVGETVPGARRWSAQERRDLRSRLRQRRG
jgi:hypothetical protein